MEAIVQGKVKPVVVRTYLSGSAGKAIDHAGAGRAQEKVAITV